MKETFMNASPSGSQSTAPWNKGRLIGQKLPLKLKEIGAIRIRLQLAQRVRNLALFNLAIDSKLRGCALIKLHLGDIALANRLLPRATIMQQKTRHPVQFDITEQTRTSIAAGIDKAHLSAKDYLFPSRVMDGCHITTRQYARIIASWVESIGLDRAAYGTHTMRRKKATLIYRQTKNLRAVQLVLGHTKLESTVRYLGIEVDDALDIAENTKV
jgi:integrase